MSGVSIRCRCGHTGSDIQFAEPEPSEKQKQRYAYQTGKPLKRWPRWRCPACSARWEVTLGAQNQPVVVVLSNGMAA